MVHEETIALTAQWDGGSDMPLEDRRVALPLWLTDDVIDRVGKVLWLLIVISQYFQAELPIESVLAFSNGSLHFFDVDGPSVVVHAPPTM